MESAGSSAAPPTVVFVAARARRGRHRAYKEIEPTTQRPVAVLDREPVEPNRGLDPAAFAALFLICSVALAKPHLQFARRKRRLHVGFGGTPVFVHRAAHQQARRSPSPPPTPSTTSQPRRRWAPFAPPRLLLPVPDR